MSILIFSTKRIGAGDEFHRPVFQKKHTSKTSSHCFIQVSIVSDMFMNSIEEITSRSKQAELNFSE